MKLSGIRKLYFPTIARIFMVVYIISIVLLLIKAMSFNHLLSLDFLLKLFHGLYNFIIFGFIVYLLSLIIVIGDTIFHHRSRNILFAIFCLLISIPIPMIFLLNFMGEAEHSLSSITLDDHQYFLTFSAGDFGENTFYECDKNGFDCITLSTKSSSTVEDPMKLVYDQKIGSIVAFQKRGSHTWVSFVYKDQIRYMDWVQIAEFHNDLYMLTSNRQKDTTSFFISKCFDENELIGSCEILPFGYSFNENKDVKLIYDKFLDALQVVADDEVIYSYNGQSHCLSDECTLRPFL
jgi:hypothetical protein